MIDKDPKQVEMFQDSPDKGGKVDAAIRPGSRFGTRIRELRDRHGIAQRVLAERLGVSPAYLSQLESGKKGRPSDRIIHAICQQFGLIWDDADDLFSLADSSKRIVKIDTSRLDAGKTELAMRFAERLSSLSKAQINQVLAALDL